MRANIHTSSHLNGPCRASAAEPPADPRAALPKFTWKQYQKNGLRETRVLRLQGQDELLFQFCKSKGWPHARHVGTITPYQAWLALKKMGRDDYDVTKAKIDFALWDDPGASSRTSLRSDRDEAQLTEHGSASTGAHPQHPQNGKHSLANPEADVEESKLLLDVATPVTLMPADVDAEDIQALDGTLWDQPLAAEEQVDDDACDEIDDVPKESGSSRRFWQFNDSRPEPEPLLQPSRKQRSSKRKSTSQQPKEVDLSANSLSSRFAEPKPLQSTAKEAAHLTEERIEGPYTTPDGWTVINDSLMDSIPGESGEDNLQRHGSMENVSLRNGNKRYLGEAQEVGSSDGAKHSRREGSERNGSRSGESKTAEEQQPRTKAGATGPASEGFPSTAKQRDTISLRARFGRSAKRFSGFCRDRINGLLRGSQAVLNLAAHSAKVAFWASSFLLRKVAWALVRQPGPPEVHASPQIAQLCRCASAEKAHRLSLKLGYDGTGRKADPLQDLPRWRVESLVGTFVLDMSLYRRALTAPSAVPDSITASYERLEYLGDGILEGIIRQFIYSRWPEVTEHAMCAMVSGLVSGRTLHDFARGLHLQRCLALDAAAQWEAKHLSGWADGMLADSFEALLAALFMDRGFNAARALVLRLIKDFVDLERLPYNRDYKGILGNILSICKAGRPKYRCRLIQMPEAEAQKFSLVPSKAPLPGTEELLWEAAVQLRRGTWASPMVLGKAYDIRRMTAEQQAARAALQSLGLQIKELSLVEANQMSMAQMAGNMPGLSSLKAAMEESNFED